MMEPASWPLFVLGVALSVLIGVSLGLLGGGGSILTVPILVYVFELPTHQAVATSLVVVGTTSAFALIPHVRAHRVRPKVGLTFGVSGMLAAYVTGRLAHGIPARPLLFGFAAVMILTALAMIRGRKAATPSGPPSPIKVALLGLLVGALTGTAGAGGGFIIVPTLVLFAGLPMPEAVGTSLLVIVMQCLAAFLGHLSQASLDPMITIAVTLAATTGSFVGAHFSSRLDPGMLRKGFGWLVLGVAIFTIVRELLHTP